MEGDIRGCFDNISHKILLRIIKKSIKDEKLLGLIQKILRAGYIENGVRNKPGYGIPAIGTPQGGIISPLFANIYLHEFDRWFDDKYGSGPTEYQRKKRRKSGSGNAKLIRYADDFVILWNGSKINSQTLISPQETAVDIVTMKEQVQQFLQNELELELSEDKTLITHVHNGFDFLGFHIQRYRMGKKDVTLTTVPDSKILRFKQKIQMATRGKGAIYESVSSKIMAANSIINGWAEYYKYTNWKGRDVPTTMDWFINERMMRWARSKHSKLPYGEVIGKYRQRQTGYKINGRAINRMNFGFKIESSYMTDEEIIWLAMLADKPSAKYMPKKKLNPFITYQYEESVQLNTLDKWEGRSSNPYASDEYWKGKKLALKRDKQRCRLCGKKVTVGVDNHCHHVDGNSDNHSLGNLVTLCIECHYHIYGKEHEFTF